MNNQDQIYTLYLELHPHHNGTLIMVPELVSEEVYQQIKGNLTTIGHKGRVELGFSQDDGVALRLAFSNLGLLNQGVTDLLGMGKDIIEHGIQDSIVKKSNRRDLEPSFNQLDVLWHTSIPQPKSLGIFSEDHLFNYDDTLAPLTKAGILVNKARLIPEGYEPQTK